MGEHEYFTPEEVAEMLKVHPLTVYRMIKDGRLRANRIGRSLRISRQSIDEWSTESSTSASPSPEPEPEE